MITRRQLEEFRGRVRALEPPVLSLYTFVNPATEHNHPKAILLRVKETLKNIAVPESVARRVLDHFGDSVHQARSEVVFANGSDMEVLRLQVDLPVVDPITGHVEVRYGEAYLTPLVLALDEYERYGVLYVGRNQWRLFEVFLGEIAELEDRERPLAPHELDELNETKRSHPAYIADRGGSEKDAARAHLNEWSYRFYKQAAERTDQTMRFRGMDRLILLGTSEDTHWFWHAAPRPLRNRLIIGTRSLSSPEAPPKEVLERVGPMIAEREALEEDRLLNQIREKGVWGLDSCLREIQRGRIHTLAVPWRPDQPVYVAAKTGYVAASEELARAQSPNGGSVERRLLTTVLPDLVSAWGMRLEFMRGANQEALVGQLGSMAGLTRW